MKVMERILKGEKRLFLGKQQLFVNGVRNL